MAKSRGEFILATDLNKTQGNYALATDDNKTQGSFIISPTISINNIQILYRTNDDETLYANRLRSYGNGFQFGTEGGGSVQITIIQINLITIGKSFSFHYAFGQALSTDSSATSSSSISGVLEVGYGTPNDETFISLWTLESAGRYYDTTGNYGDKTISLTSIPTGNVIKMRVIKKGNYWRYNAQITNATITY